MKQFRYLSHFLWLLLSGLPPISIGTLLRPTIFASSWMILCAVGTPVAIAFVWALVLAQAIQIWVSIPRSVWQLRQSTGSTRNSIWAAMVISLASIAFQIWYSEPWLSQRVISIYCAVYAALVAIAASGDEKMVACVSPEAKNSDVSMVFQLHLFKLNAVVAILALAINESLLAAQPPISTRVAVLSVLPIALHYFYHIALRLTCPPLDKHNS